MNAQTKRLTKLHLKKFRSAIKKFNMKKMTETFGCKEFAQAYLDGLQSEVEILEEIERLYK